MSEDAFRIIGIDPGSRYTGYGLVERRGSEFVHIASGRINATSGDDFASRLALIYRGLTTILGDHRADEAAIETVFTAHNVRSTIKLGQARGVALLALNHADLPIDEYSPSKVKKTVVGHGRATKQQVIDMIRMRLNLGGTIAEDAADALAIALCHGQVVDFKRKLHS